MSCSLGLWIGESFAEVRGLPSQSFAEPTVQSRWLLARRGLTEGLRDILKGLGDDTASGSLHIATSRAEQILERKQGREPALLVTSGFESWLKTRTPLLSSTFSLHPTRAPLLTSEDRIFGLSERVSADGQMLKPVSAEELEFLVAKLELLKIKSVAIGLLHSSANPENEETVARYLREKGFLVIPSHHFANENSETHRWLSALECAYAEPAIAEERQQIEDALKEGLGENYPAWDVSVWGATGLTPFSEFSAANARSGVQRSLINRAVQTDARFLLHFGLESFHLLVHEAQAGNQAREIELPVQPTREITSHGMWHVPAIGTQDRGYEPGPMLFGKAHALSLLDILFVRERLAKVESLTPLINERGRARIMEALFMLGKTIPNAPQGPVDAMHVAEDIEHACLERIAGALSIAGAQGKVLVSGPLASAFDSQLKKRRPDLTFTLEKNAEWSQADACLAGDLASKEFSTIGSKRS